MQKVIAIRALKYPNYGVKIYQVLANIFNEYKRVILYVLTLYTQLYMSLYD